MHPGQPGEMAFSNQGFTHLDGLHLYMREASMVPEELAVVERFGGHVPGGGLWESMKGFSAAKGILDRRVVAPLAHAELADKLGLVPPAAVLLFGPPGTGKTSFARAIASRLSWAFVELHPSLLGQGVDGARALHDALADLGKVDRLVCFIDEADEIASDRSERLDSQPLVNELLKAIPVFKSRPQRLMVMATNSIAAIDPALLRPGRFDLIIPVGAPDEDERADLAAEFLTGADPKEVADRTAGFTPADFSLVAQRSAQLAFDRALGRWLRADRRRRRAGGHPADPAVGQRGGGPALRYRGGRLRTPLIRCAPSPPSVMAGPATCGTVHDAPSRTISVRNRARGSRAINGWSSCALGFEVVEPAEIVLQLVAADRRRSGGRRATRHRLERPADADTGRGGRSPRSEGPRPVRSPWPPDHPLPLGDRYGPGCDVGHPRPADEL